MVPPNKMAGIWHYIGLWTLHYWGLSTLFYLGLSTLLPLLRAVHIILFRVMNSTAITEGRPHYSFFFSYYSIQNFHNFLIYYSQEFAYLSHEFTFYSHNLSKKKKIAILLLYFPIIAHQDVVNSSMDRQPYSASVLPKWYGPLD